MQRATATRNAISPLLDQLINQLAAEGHQTESRYFHRIRVQLDDARDEFSLTHPIFALSSAPAVGFRFSPDADVLVARILAKLADVYDLPPAELHTH